MQHRFNYRFNLLSFAHSDLIHPIATEHYFVSLITALATNYHIVISGDEAVGK